MMKNEIFSIVVPEAVSSAAEAQNVSVDLAETGVAWNFWIETASVGFAALGIAEVAAVVGGWAPHWLEEVVDAVALLAATAA